MLGIALRTSLQLVVGQELTGSPRQREGQYNSSLDAKSQHLAAETSNIALKVATAFTGLPVFVTLWSMNPAPTGQAAKKSSTETVVVRWFTVCVSHETGSKASDWIGSDGLDNLGLFLTQIQTPEMVP